MTGRSLTSVLEFLWKSHEIYHFACNISHENLREQLFSRNTKKKIIYFFHQKHEAADPLIAIFCKIFYEICSKVFTKGETKYLEKFNVKYFAKFRNFCLLLKLLDIELKFKALFANNFWRKGAKHLFRTKTFWAEMFSGYFSFTTSFLLGRLISHSQPWINHCRF